MMSKDGIITTLWPRTTRGRIVAVLLPALSLFGGRAAPSAAHSLQGKGKLSHSHPSRDAARTASINRRCRKR